MRQYTYITTTNPCVFDAHDHIMGAFELRHGAVLKLDLVNSFENEGKILHTVSILHKHSWTTHLSCLAMAHFATC